MVAAEGDADVVGEVVVKGESGQVSRNGRKSSIETYQIQLQMILRLQQMRRLAV